MIRRVRTLLKRPARCHACEEMLPVGSPVEAVLLSVGEEEATEWLKSYVAFCER